MKQKIKNICYSCNEPIRNGKEAFFVAKLFCQRCDSRRKYLGKGITIKDLYKKWVKKIE